MPGYVALLGSINVGGNRLKMADLKAAVEEHGFTDVSTVVASGNLLFEHKRAGDATLAAEVEALVKARFGIACFVAVRSRDEIERAIIANPFATDGEPHYVHTVFLENPVAPEAIRDFAASFSGPERIAVARCDLYIDYAAGVGRSQIDPALKKAKLITGRATARNIRSLKRILAKMDS